MKLSYVHGASDKPLIGLTIGQYFDAACERYQEKDAIVVRHQAIRLTFAELRERVDNLACGLIRLGLEPGDRIGIWSPNNIEWVLTQFAAAKLGLILVNINPAYRRAELQHALKKVGCRALVLAPSFKASNYLKMLQDLAPELSSFPAGRATIVNFPTLQWVVRLGDDVTPGMLNFKDVASPATDDERKTLQKVAEDLQFDDPINIQFTSGTTGAPKGATLSHHSILNNGYFIGEKLKLSSTDSLCIPVPLYHCFGMVLGNLACLTHGTVMVFPSESFDALATIQAVTEERCTALYGVPTMFIAMLDHADFEKYDLSSLRTGIMAGSPCPIEVMRRVVDRMHMKEVTIAYGMTETSPASFQSAIDDPVERRVATVGCVHPHVEVKIVDDLGHIVPRGSTGELLTRGYSVMLGYWGDESKTRDAIDAAGWIHTGDLATIDHQGYCNIVGRLKDMVIRGGENIYPREVEEFIYQHPKVLDVQVVGVPDSKYGEEMCAWIIAKAGERPTDQEIREFCQGQIAHYKIPRYIRFVDAYPLTATGKVQKFKIREAMISELNLEGHQSA
ncbi:AMP-binding protein [Burkholderia multivorans]|uniref:AMP-binding protein n=1 Tax=Burkholderia multivorans TaxID=87883 RepID=UPI001C225580|nr:AMP-binding protein [Burkholderia multivorans]MBU9480683.1 AMP-binding protein [Burkholderia multivorans]